MDRQAHAGAVRAAQHLSVDDAPVQDRFGRNQFGDADKTQAGGVGRAGEQRIHGCPQLNNYLSLFGTRRDQLAIEAKFTPALLTLDLNDVVQVKWPRFGYDSGKLFRVIAQRFDFSTNRFQLTLWG